MLASTYLTINQSEEYPRVDHSLVLNTVSPRYPSQVGHTVLQALTGCGPFAGKVIKLFLSNSPQTLSLRFNPAPVHRG